MKEYKEFDKFYVKGEELGKGSYGTVFKAEEKETGRSVAVKQLRTVKRDAYESVQREVNILESIRHDHILEFINAFQKRVETLLVTEHLKGGELFERVCDEDTVPESDCCRYLRQICSALEYLHGQNIVHLDLKPENIVLKSNDSDQVKIIDFGLATRLSEDKEVNVMQGTPEYISPEVLNYDPIDFKTDMWSVGVITYVLLSGISPFASEDENKTFSNILMVKYNFEDEAFDGISQFSKEFIKSLLQKQISGRMSAQQCLKHPWLEDAGNFKGFVRTKSLRNYITARKKMKRLKIVLKALGAWKDTVTHGRLSRDASLDEIDPRDFQNNTDQTIPNEDVTETKENINLPPEQPDLKSEENIIDENEEYEDEEEEGKDELLQNMDALKLSELEPSQGPGDDRSDTYSSSSDDDKGSSSNSDVDSSEDMHGALDQAFGDIESSKEQQPERNELTAENELRLDKALDPIRGFRKQHGFGEHRGELKISSALNRAFDSVGSSTENIDQVGRRRKLSSSSSSSSSSEEGMIIENIIIEDESDEEPTTHATTHIDKPALNLPAIVVDNVASPARTNSMGGLNDNSHSNSNNNKPDVSYLTTDADRPGKSASHLHREPKPNRIQRSRTRPVPGSVAKIIFQISNAVDQEMGVCHTVREKSPATSPTRAPVRSNKILGGSSRDNFSSIKSMFETKRAVGAPGRDGVDSPAIKLLSPPPGNQPAPSQQAPGKSGKRGLIRSRPSMKVEPGRVKKFREKFSNPS